MANPQTIEERLLHAVEANGAVDWHLSCTYEDDELSQSMSVRPEYDYDDSPFDGGELTIEVIRGEGDDVTSSEVTLSVPEFTRLCHQALALISADQAAYNQSAALAPAEEEEEDEDDGEATPGDAE